MAFDTLLDAISITTEGILSGPALLAVYSIDTATVPDDGGVIVTASGYFPTDVAISVRVVDTFDLDCYSGAIGYGLECWSDDGSTLSFVVPKMPVGGPYDLVFTPTGSTAVTFANSLTVIKRSFSSVLYGIRSRIGVPRDPGPRELMYEDWGSSIEPELPLEALVTAISDTVLEVAGFLLTRTTAAYTAGDATMAVESTDRWPESGSFAVPGGTGTYTGVTSTSLTGVSCDVDVVQAGMVMEASRTVSIFDQLRRSFFVTTADGRQELAILTRNYGLIRPRGFADETWRSILQAMMYIEAQTMYAFEQICDIVYGPGSYEVYEDVINYPCTVFLRVPGTIGGTTDGKTYLVGLEAQAQTSATTVTLDHTPTTVYGIWTSTDTGRQGTNYALGTLSTLMSVNNDRVTGPAATFTADDVGKPLIYGSEGWKIAELISSSEVRCAGRTRTNGVLDGAAPTELTVPTPTFLAWMVGHQITIESDTNGGTYTIASITDAYTAVLTGAAFLTEIDVHWHLVPDWAATAGVSVDVLRATASGAVVTAPSGVTFPANMLIDYTVARNDAQLQTLNYPAASPRAPFYLFDHGSAIRSVISLLTASGVAVEVETMS
jgi:hypothetical protein